MPVESSLVGGIAVLSVSNPPNHYIDEEVVADLDRGFRRAESNEAVKVVIITGGEKDAFLLHYDLKQVEATSRQLVAKKASFGERRHIPERRIDVLFRRLENSPKIVIAAINGTALGGATELALACDFRLLKRGDFVMGVPEIRIGMLPGAGGTQRLTRLVGVGTALDMVLHGRRLSPDEALARGLVHEVTEGPVLDRAMERARDLAALPALALAHVKRLVLGADQQTLYANLDLERALFLELMAQPEAVEMVGALNARGGDFRTV